MKNKTKQNEVQSKNGTGKRINIPDPPDTSSTHFKQSRKQMKKSRLMLSTFTANNSRSIISYKTAGQKRINAGGLADKNDNLLHTDTTDYMNDVRIFRQKMGKRIESNRQHLSDIKAKIKKENKEANADFFTTIFELNLANGYMKIKLDDFNPRVADKWKIFKQEFSKEMDEWNIEFADFLSII